MRRIGVVVGVAALVGGLVVAVGSFRGSGSSDGTADAPSSLPASTERTAGEATTTLAAGTSSPSASADAGRVLLVGDSESGGLSGPLGDVLKPMGLKLKTDYQISSGLVRPDFFDWPAHLRATLPGTGAGTVVALFGGNDGQPFLDMPDKRVDSPEWRAEYAKRVGEVVELLSAEGRTLIWVGVPDARKASLSAALRVQNEVVRAEIAKHPKVVFIDSWALFSGIDGHYAPFAFDPRNGRYVSVRSNADGFHLNTAGEEILASVVGDAIATALVARGGAGPAVTAPPTRFDAANGGTYVVSAGDSLSRIAGETGTTVAAIVAANGWADETQPIFPGATIKLPART